MHPTGSAAHKLLYGPFTFFQTLSCGSLWLTPTNLLCGAECCVLSYLLPVQVDTAATGQAKLGENPVAAAADLALLGGLLEEEEPKGPTMMGREARQLMLSGQGAAGLAAWKVHPFPLPALHPWSSVGPA